MANLSEQTVSIATVVGVVSPLIGAAITGAIWTVKRIVGKLDKALEDMAEDLSDVEDDVRDMGDRCRRAEDKLRREREESCKEVQRLVAELRKECKECQLLRVAEHTDCVDTYGKFGARITKLETEHSIYHRGELCR